MQINRRHILLSGLAASAATSTTAAALTGPATPSGLDAPAPARPNGAEDQTATLQRAIDQAASTRTPVILAPTEYRVGGLTLPPGVQLVGVPGATRLTATRPQPILFAPHAGNVRVSGIAFDGGGQSLPQDQGLISLANGRNVLISDCEVIGSAARGLSLLAIGGEISGNRVLGSADVGIFSLDARGLSIVRNVVRRAGNNGIQVWTSDIRDDGTLVADNLVEEIGARAGGSGQNGNGINVFRAGGVTVRGNRIRACLYSAVRGNSASNIQIVGNTCMDLGEVALYSEFAFVGAIIANNTVDVAGIGVSVTNFNEGGRLAVVQGNILRNLAPQRDAPGAADEHGVGVYVEADTSVTGNVIEQATRAGIVAGWGRYLRDVTVTGNVVRSADIGIGVSVVSGAGNALIANNLISGTPHGAVVGLDHLQAVTPDLARGGAARYSQLVVNGNQVN